jgi:hypothetical protein
MKQLENEGSGRWGVKAQSLDEAVPTPKWSSLPPEPAKVEEKKREQVRKEHRRYYFTMGAMGAAIAGCRLDQRPPERYVLPVPLPPQPRYERDHRGGAQYQRHLELEFIIRNVDHDGDVWYQFEGFR